MVSITIYDLDYEDITNICEDNDVMEYEVIAAMLDAIKDEKIDISAWL